MFETAQTQQVRLNEHIPKRVLLSAHDAAYAGDIGFSVIVAQPTEADDTAEGYTPFEVNPKQFVGHFRLPSGRIVQVQPKIHTANVFRMLAYVYLNWNEAVFHDSGVLYSTEDLLFEPLVELFNQLVRKRVLKGLVKDYVRYEKNLRILKGAMSVHPHVQQNLARPDRMFCRYFENTVDIEDNRIIKLTLQQLLAVGGWRARTVHDLKSNLHQFQAVQLLPTTRGVFAGRHYHRLNDDYQPIHQLSSLFLDSMAVSESPGVIPFRGFLLDMNLLFEKVVEQAFLKAGLRRGATVRVQEPERISPAPHTPSIVPDVVIALGPRVIGIVDAKYKKDVFGPQNPDLYQVIAYGTALHCPQVFLFYPETELGTNQDIPIRNSEIVIGTRRVKVHSSDFVRSIEEAAERVVRAIVDSHVLQSMSWRSEVGNGAARILAEHRTSEADGDHN